MTRQGLDPLLWDTRWPLPWQPHPLGHMAKPKQLQQAKGRDLSFHPGLIALQGTWGAALMLQARKQKREQTEDQRQESRQPVLFPQTLEHCGHDTCKVTSTQSRAPFTASLFGTNQRHMVCLFRGSVAGSGRGLQNHHHLQGQPPPFTGEREGHVRSSSSGA